MDHHCIKSLSVFVMLSVPAMQQVTWRFQISVRGKKLLPSESSQFSWGTNITERIQLPRRHQKDSYDHLFFRMLFSTSPSKASLILFLCKLDAELSRLGAELILAFVWVMGLKPRCTCMLALPLITLSPDGDFFMHEPGYL